MKYFTEEETEANFDKWAKENPGLAQALLNKIKGVKQDYIPWYLPENKHLWRQKSNED